MATKVTYWKSIDDSLHLTQEEAVKQDISIIGEDAFYELILNRINESYGESKSFDYYEIPKNIVHRLIKNDYISVLWPNVSNADLPEQFSIIIHKKGIEPTEAMGRRRIIIK